MKFLVIPLFSVKKKVKFFLSLSLVVFIKFNIQAQCFDVPLPDSSFESGLLGTLTGWNPDDGVLIVSDSNAYHGNNMACFSTGGVNCEVKVDSHTTYYLSCYVMGGGTFVLIDNSNGTSNGSYFTPTTSNWSLISKSFNSGSDTLLIVGIYSLGWGTCADLFRLTCSPLGVGMINIIKEPSFTLDRTSSRTYFTLSTREEGTLVVYDAVGRAVFQRKVENSTINFGNNWLPGIYLVSFYKDNH